MRRAWAWALVLPSVFGCGREAGSSMCELGETRACLGPGACEGGQTCETRGWSECDCGNGTVGADGTQVGEGCGTAVAEGTDPLIDNLDDGDHLIPVRDGRAGSWYTYNDGTGIQDPAPPDGCDRTYAIEFPDGQACTSGRGFSSWGAQLNLNLVNAPSGCLPCPYDMSVYEGIRFTLSGKSDRPIRFEIGTVGTSGPEGGGTCAPDDECWNDYGAMVPLSETSQTVTVYFDELTQDPQWGLQVPWDPAEAIVLRWQINPGYDADGGITDYVDEFDLCVDDVEFF